MSNSNVKPFMPPPPPGPYKYPNRSAFRANGTLMIDTANLTVLADRVNAARISAGGDPSSNVPPITTLGIHSPYLYAHYLDAANVDQFRVAAVIANDQVQLIANTIVTGSMTIGKQFNWKPPQFSSIYSIQPNLKGGTLGQTYPLSGGQLRGYAKLYVPQPGVATSGQIINLNGGQVTGSALIYT